MAIITLLTDYGTTDSYVGEIKGVLLTLAPGATLVDVTHEVAQWDIAAAAYVVGRTWHRFPAGTIHLAVVDPGVGTARPALAISTRGHFFVGPDNGLWGDTLAGARDSRGYPSRHGRRVDSGRDPRKAAGNRGRCGEAARSRRAATGSCASEALGRRISFPFGAARRA